MEAWGRFSTLYPPHRLPVSRERKKTKKVSNVSRDLSNMLYIQILTLVLICCLLVPSAAMRMLIKNPSRTPFKSLNMSSRGSKMGNQIDNNVRTHGNINRNKKNSRSSLAAKSSGSGSSTGSTSTNGGNDRSIGSFSSSIEDNSSEEFQPLYSQVGKKDR